MVGAVLAQSPTQQINPPLGQPNLQPWLQQMLLEEMKKEPAFAQEVQKHLQSIFGDQQGEQFLTQIFGGEVGKIINIMCADVVNIE